MSEVVLGYCDDVGSKGMTLHERREDCVNWSPQRRVSVDELEPGVVIVGGSPAFTLDGQPVVWFENWIRARTRSERMR
jgi:hypothetical protein